jgi:subtilisin family serine protease/photosystem II stability/assembly factor-like uncharacterized protein
MKSNVITGLLTCLTFISCYNTSLAQNKVKSEKPTAYEIVIPGKQLADGYFSTQKIIQIEQLAKEDYLPNSIYVKLTSTAKNKFKPGYNVQTDPLLQSVKSIEATAVVPVNTELLISDNKDVHGINRIYEITYSADRDPYDVCKELIQNPDVEYAIPVFKRYIYAFTPNDPQLANQWALTKILAKDAWDISKGDTNIVIAVVDGGTDWQHNDLSANIWINHDEIPNNGIDDDTSGKIDDIRGWDFVGNVTVSDIQTSNWKEDNNPKNPAASHGTQTAGCAGAVTNNGTGISSIGFNCRLMPVKCGADNSSIPGIYRGYTAILYAANMGADIISCSWGGPGYSLAEEDILKQVTDMGILIVAASGNNGQNTDIAPFYPGAYPEVLNVGSTDSDDGFASSSNYGSKVGVFAPGDNIFSTSLNNTYNSSSGTSLACPIVSGLAGLVRSHHPDWTPYQVRQQIRVTCDNILAPDQQAYRHLYWGRINALKALQYNSGNPAFQLPGINAYSFALSGTSELNNYNSTDLRLYLTNYLAEADSVKVSIEPLSNFISVSTKDFWIQNLGTFDTAQIDVAVQLRGNTPWFKGNAELLVTYSAPGYTDIQKIELPINLPSNNSFSSKGAINSSIYPEWHGISASDYNTCWGVGESQIYGAIYFRNSLMGFVANRVSTGTAYITDPVYCIHAFDETTAVAGTGKGYTLRTVNGGSTWTNISVSNITNFVNAILFKDPNNGILLGDPKLSKWGIAITTDKGLTWSQLNTVPAPLTNESGYVESVSLNGNEVCFGTSQGRIYYSPDFGNTWKVSTVFAGGMITSMAFYDSLHGMTSYTEANGTGQSLYLANTTDGGKTWNKKLMNLTEEGLFPTKMINLPYTKKILCTFSNGYVYTTDDLGLTWEPVLSQQSVIYEATNQFFQQNTVRLWEIGDYLNVLTFEYEFDTTLTALSPVCNQSVISNLYPVPANDVIHISTSLSKGEETEIQLLDYTGKQVRQIFKGTAGVGYSNFTVSVSDIAPGTYFIRVLGEKQVTTRPVLIIR